MNKHPFSISEYVRSGDVDLAGIICYGAYIRFFEIAETELFRAVKLPFSEMFERFDMWLPRKVMHAEFHSPALLDEQLRVVTYISHVGRTSLRINFDVVRHDGTVLHATAHQVLVCVGRSDLVKKPLPAGVIEALSPFTMTEDEARAAVLERRSGVAATEDPALAAAEHVRS
jgi:acyl-CoA thioester hydrolase